MFVRISGQVPGYATDDEKPPDGLIGMAGKTYRSPVVRKSPSGGAGGLPPIPEKSPTMAPTTAPMAVPSGPKSEPAAAPSRAPSPAETASASTDENAPGGRSATRAATAVAVPTALPSAALYAFWKSACPCAIGPETFAGKDEGSPVGNPPPKSSATPKSAFVAFFS